MLRTTSYLVTDPVIPAGYAMVNGVLKGPSMEPSPGSGGSIPPPQGPGKSGPFAPVIDPSMVTVKRVTETVDLNSGHRVAVVSVLNRGEATEEEKATLDKLSALPVRAGQGNRLQVGRPVDETRKEYDKRTQPAPTHAPTAAPAGWRGSSVEADEARKETT